MTDTNPTDTTAPEEPNWDTEEAFAMLNCDEGVYTAALRAERPEAVQQVFEESFPNHRPAPNADVVDVSKVDWDQVYVWLNPADTH